MSAAAEPRRPLLLRAPLPDRVRNSLFARYYRPRAERWSPLYDRAQLRYAPGRFLEGLTRGDWICDSVAFTGTYEASLSRQLAALGRGGGLLVDVGANLGYFSVLWAAANSSNRVIAIEASPRVVGRLRHNVGANGLEHRVTVIEKGAGRAAGSLPFSPGPADQSGWGGLTLTEGEGTVIVEVVRLDELLADVGSIDVLKIDIEGADAWAIMGAAGLLRQRRVREIWYEENVPRMRQLGIAPGEAAAFLRQIGYRAERRGGRADVLSEWRAVPTR